MLKFFIKIWVNALLVFIILECLVRVFHLYNDMPDWYLAEDNTYKRIPGQEGYAVYGNRRQKTSKYRINKAGYNSFREFEPSTEKVEVALLGDSFIEGLHQDYQNSIGKKVEQQLNNVHLYEYGHSNFDLADQMFLIHANKKVFERIDLIIYEFKYDDDLLRNSYQVEQRKVVFPLLRHSKLLVYMLDIGMIDPIKKVLRNINIGQEPRAKVKMDKDSIFLGNFKELVKSYGLDRRKSAFLLDTRKTPLKFLNYLKDKEIDIIDYGPAFEKSSDTPTTLIFDQHWNNHGRELIAEEIAQFLENKRNFN